MAEKKKTTKPAAKKNTKPAAKPAAKKSAPKAEPVPRPVRDENSLLHRILPYVFVVFAILLGVCFIFHDGPVSGPIYKAFFGLFGLVSILVPFLLVYSGIFWRKWVADGQHVLKCIFSAVCLICGGALTQLFLIAFAGADKSMHVQLGSLWSNGTQLVGGGVFGGAIGIGLYKAFATAAPGIILSIAILLVFGFFFFGITPKSIWINLRYSAAMHKERRAAAKEKAEREREFAYEAEEADDTLVPPEPESFDPAKPYDTAVPNPDFDMNVGDEEFATAENPTIEPVAEDEPAAAEEPKSVYNQYGEIDLGAIFVDEPAEEKPDENGEVGGEDIGDALTAETATLTVTTEEVETTPPPAPKPKPQKAAYHFPPITLLAPPEKKTNEDVGAELRANAQKLVETLKSFHVNVTVASVSRGPTITRYELIPEAGTRVRSIANLVDDISLSLATSGIRIEAPIPGKAAVGIEVPNKTVSTVTLRELIENKTFSEAKSKLAVCLGKDVGGAPIVFDIAKMPHLLIAGATGMGKSVCINSIITSILYKATPEEVKLILIDPKKVEFNIYNGIPHLQIPVVSEPKKAAGALHWAVTEMERRYELIEEVGARKIEPYNEIARQRGLEVLPYTVIIIDELADLMMNAPDAVEDSSAAWRRRRVRQVCTSSSVHSVRLLTLSPV